MTPGQQLQVEVPAAPPAAPVPEEIMVEVPEGATAGQQLTVTAPNGQQVTVTVPEGMTPGQQLQVEVPAAPPKNATRLVGASSLDRGRGGGGAAEAVGEEPGLVQAAELQAEAAGVGLGLGFWLGLGLGLALSRAPGSEQAEASALRLKLAAAEARLDAAAKEVEQAGMPALAAFTLNIEVAEGGTPDPPSIFLLLPTSAHICPHLAGARGRPARPPRARGDRPPAAPARRRAGGGARAAHLSPWLPISPHLSSHLPVSRRISPHLPTSRRTSQAAELHAQLRAAAEEERRHREAAAAELRDARRQAEAKLLESERALAALRAERLQLKEVMLVRVGVRVRREAAVGGGPARGRLTFPLPLPLT